MPGTEVKTDVTVGRVGLVKSVRVVGVLEGLSEALVSSGLPQRQGLWVQQTWVWHKPAWRK